MKKKNAKRHKNKEPDLCVSFWLIDLAFRASSSKVEVGVVIGRKSESSLSRQHAKRRSVTCTPELNSRLSMQKETGTEDSRVEEVDAGADADATCRWLLLPSFFLALPSLRSASGHSLHQNPSSLWNERWAAMTHM
jgi:hypothetical protein